MTGACEFKTSDILLAATLVYKGFALKEYSNSGLASKYIFCFDDSPDLQGIVGDYYCNNILVDPEQFYQKVKQLKSRVSNHVF